MVDEIDEEDYAALAGFRFELRRFLRFSEQAAREAGLTPQQHQALLVIRASSDDSLLVGDLAERLFLKPHSASELIKRLADRGFVDRQRGRNDRREMRIMLTEKARIVLASLAATHRAELRRLRPLIQRLLAAL